ncbi:MAG TPA: hypothetical protein VFP56_12280 [Candidatus Limnocylindrales bacterium]|nr:hypothetical protein [Candidatus Limnocylindrales bacterium]
MQARGARRGDAVAVDLVGVIGLCAVLLGLIWLQASEELAFDPGAALNGVLSQLAITLPIAVLVLAASALELGAGLVLARLVRRTPFDSYAEALLAAMVAAVLKGTFLLGTLAAVGLFRQPILIAIDVAILALALAPQTRRWTRPLLDARPWREQVGSIGSLTLAALVVVVWAAPVVLQLASPVVPFVDVLPNYVGPVEHLRTFGWFSPLSATQSPIIGPSRTVLGYDGLLGSLATITDLPGGRAIAGFILPQTILVAAGANRLASSLRHGDTPIAAWALLAFALSQPFARLADARGTVVVTPLVCLGIALAAEALHDRDGHHGRHGRRATTSSTATREGDRDRARDPAPWRIGRGAAIGLALGAAIYVHPVIGFFAVATVAIAALVRPAALAPAAFVASLTAGLLALPQAATMAGLSLPTLALGAWLPVAVAVGVAAGWTIERRAAFERALVRLAAIGRWALLAAIVVGVAGAFGIGALRADRLPDALEQTRTLVQDSSELLLVVLVIGVVLGSRGARSPLVLAGLGIGIAAAMVAFLLPDGLGFLGDALRYEVPKTVHYWLSTVAAAGAAVALAHTWATATLPLAVRAGALAAFVAMAALPIRDEPIDAFHLGEHRWSETMAIDLRWAGRGFWVGFPDPRIVVDAPRQELLDALRAEIAAGRLRHDTEVLHVARTFQQWMSTPLGVFDGVFETSISLEPEVSHQTVGGRLFGSRDPAEMLRQLGERLATGGYAYIVLEPDGVPAEARSRIEDAGYEAIFENARGTVFRIGG